MVTKGQKCHNVLDLPDGFDGYPEPYWGTGSVGRASASHCDIVSTFAWGSEIAEGQGFDSPVLQNFLNILVAFPVLVFLLWGNNPFSALQIISVCFREKPFFALGKSSLFTLGG